MSEKINTIGKDFTMLDMIKFTAAPVISKLFISLLQTIDDSLFISRYCGQDALAAFTMTLPWFMLVDAVVMTLCAVASKCSRLMGEKKNDEANSAFTTILLIMVGIGCIFTLILSFFRDNILRFLGATETLLPIVSTYMNVSRFYMPLLFATNMFSRFYIIAGKPKVAVASTIVQIACNLICDYLFIARMGIGIVGAAYGNLAGNIFLCIIGIVFFSNSKAEIHFGKLYNKPFDLFKEVVILGKSQGMNSVAISFNTFLTNQILMAKGGEILVSAFTIVNNIQFMFMNAFFGFIGSVSPLVSYAYGEKNQKKLAKNIKQSVILIESLALIVGIFIFLGKGMFMKMYFGDNPSKQIADMVTFGFNVIPFCFGIFSFNVIVQDFFIAVANAKISTILAMLENIVFSNIVVLVLPAVFGVDGVWFVFFVAELLTFIVTVYVVYINADVYGYGPNGIATIFDR